MASGSSMPGRFGLDGVPWDRVPGDRVRRLRTRQSNGAAGVPVDDFDGGISGFLFGLRGWRCRSAGYVGDKEAQGKKHCRPRWNAQRPHELHPCAHEYTRHGSARPKTKVSMISDGLDQRRRGTAKARLVRIAALISEAAAYSFRVTVILRASPPADEMAISPVAFLRMLLNFSPHSTRTSASGVRSSSRPNVSSCRSPSIR